MKIPNYIFIIKMNKKEKHIRTAGQLLIVIYLFLLGLNTLHYHRYSLDTDSLLDASPSRSLAATDIIQDFTGSCFIHHFANSVLNYSHTSSEIIKIKPHLTDYFHPHNIFVPSVEDGSVGLRAPPAFI
jgi:hypothetical protein